MARLFLGPEQREMIERIALSIYTDMVNAGATVQETLAAVYLSGSENALAAYRETPNFGGEARLVAHRPSQTTTATPQGVASTDQLGGRARSEKT